MASTHAPTSEPAPAPRARRRWPWLVLLVVALLVAASVVVRVPYAIMSPGPAVNTLGTDDSGHPLVSVPAGTVVAGRPVKTYPTSGALDFTTVSVRGGPGYPVTAADVVLARLTPHHEVLPADEVFAPDASADEVKAQSSREMASSQEAATVVALRRLGYTVPEKVVVAAVVKGAPADGHLLPDDVVTKVDGVPVTSTTQASKAVRALRAGTRVVLTVQRKGASTEVPLTTVSRQGRTVVGVMLAPRFTLPVTVTVRAGDVGGPSAGTMFALAIYDVLTPGALTGGAKIAGTGAIDPDGTVEPIGGIAEKMVAARRAGADWFLAPRSNCDEVVGHVPDGLHVVRVSTFGDAVDAVTAIGTGKGTGLASCD